MPMLDYDSLSPEQAQELHDRVVTRHPAVLRRLRQRVSDTGGDGSRLDGSRDSLVPLWEWYVRWWDAGYANAAAELPEWFTRASAEEVPEFPDGMFAVADELGHYLDEVALQTVRGARWRLVPEQDGVRVDGFQKSAVTLGECDLIGTDLAWVKCLRVRRGRNRESTSLHDAFRTRLEEAGLA